MAEVIDIRIEDMCMAMMLHYSGLRNCFAACTKPADQLNRIIHNAIIEMDGPIDIVTVYQHLLDSGMASEGVAQRLAWLDEIPFMKDNPFPVGVCYV